VKEFTNTLLPHINPIFRKIGLIILLLALGTYVLLLMTDLNQYLNLVKLVIGISLFLMIGSKTNYSRDINYFSGKLSIFIHVGTIISLQITNLVTNSNYELDSFILIISAMLVFEILRVSIKILYQNKKTFRYNEINVKQSILKNPITTIIVMFLTITTLLILLIR
jgi:uncharacterized membrane protein